MNLIELINLCTTEINPDSVETVTPRSCSSFEELIEHYKQELTVTQSFADCLAVCLAADAVVAISGDPLWIYLVGAPSSGKSTICDLLSADEYHTRPMSKFTGLVSGSRQGSHLVPLFQNKCVVVKDGTLLLESTPQQLANVYGELRDIFDGSLEAHYRNGVSASFSNISFGMIIGITEKVYANNMSALGERFLHVRLESDRETEISRNRNAVSSILTGSMKTEDLECLNPFQTSRAYTAGFMKMIHRRIENEEVIQVRYTDDDVKFLQCLGDIISASRAQTHKDRQDDILYTSRPESSTRCIKQLARLALGLCYIFQVTRFTEDIRRILKKAAFDTSYGRQYDILRFISLSRRPVTRSELSAATDIPVESCRRIITDLVSLGLVQEQKEPVRVITGRKNLLLKPSDWIRQAFQYVENPEKTQNRQTAAPQKNRPKKKRIRAKIVRSRT